MVNKVLREKADKKRLTDRYLKGLKLGSLLAINDVLRHAKDEDKTIEERLESVINYCNESKMKMGGSNKTENNSDEV